MHFIALEKRTWHNIIYVEMMFVLADYLFATSLDELGCPDIPPFFGDEGKKSFADHMKVMSTVTNREDYEAVSTDTQFNLQRKKIAEKDSKQHN